MVWNDFLGTAPIDRDSRVVMRFICVYGSRTNIYILENKNSSANTSLCGRRFFIEMKKGERRAALCPFLNWAL